MAFISKCTASFLFFLKNGVWILRSNPANHGGEAKITLDWAYFVYFCLINLPWVIIWQVYTCQFIEDHLIQYITKRLLDRYQNMAMFLVSSWNHLLLSTTTLKFYPMFYIIALQLFKGIYHVSLFQIQPIQGFQLIGSTFWPFITLDDLIWIYTHCSMTFLKPFPKIAQYIFAYILP